MNCFPKEEELGALLDLHIEEEMIAKIENICDEAISHSRNDQDFVVKFGDIQLIDSEDSTTINRFLKEYYDGGTFLNEEIQQGGTENRNNLRQETLGVKEFFKTSARRGLVQCPTSEVHNFDTCEYNTVMCCWVQDRQAGDDNGNCEQPYPNGKLTSSELWTPDSCIDKDPADNTDICYVDMSRSPRANHVVEGAVIYDDKDGVREGDAHCHGFAWADESLADSHRYRGNNLFYVSMYDHLRERGYVREVPGAPMCGCAEQMPTVTRADCTEMSIVEDFDFEYIPGALTFDATITSAKVEFNACEGLDGNNNNLQAYYDRLVIEGEINPSRSSKKLDDILVGDDNC